MTLIKECVDKNGKILTDFENVWKEFDDTIVKKEAEFIQREIEEQLGDQNFVMKPKKAGGVKKAKTKK